MKPDFSFFLTSRTLSFFSTNFLGKDRLLLFVWLRLFFLLLFLPIVALKLISQSPPTELTSLMPDSNIGNAVLSGLYSVYERSFDSIRYGVNSGIGYASQINYRFSWIDWMAAIKARYYENLIFNMTDPIENDGKLSEPTRRELIQNKMTELYSRFVECGHPCRESMFQESRQTGQYYKEKSFFSVV